MSASLTICAWLFIGFAVIRAGALITMISTTIFYIDHEALDILIAAGMGVFCLKLRGLIANEN